MTVHLSTISKSYANHGVFAELSLQIGEKSRIGLIGRNGCGKSTLLKIIMGQLEPDAGSIYRSPGLRVNYLSQEPRINPNLSLEAEMRSVFTELNTLAEQEAQLMHQLQNAGQASEEQQLALARRLDSVHQEMERLDARSVDARIGRILKGLGFTLADYQRLTGQFSGGWQMRINLAKVLLEGADLLLLDEPTNHLDLEACEWLEAFLIDYPGSLVIVSHDRRFLDRVTTEPAELECGKLTVWPGNYTAHLHLKAAELEQLGAAYERQQKEIAKQTAFVERFRASATRSTQAKSREKQLEKIERIELPQQDKRRMAFRFPTPQPSGRQVFTLRNVSKSFGEKKLFDGLDADFQRRQRIFLLGANGTGKTTLLRLMLGLEQPDQGEVRPGHNTQLGYFSQHQLETLDPGLSVFDTMQHACPDLTNTELRSLLGRFLFTGEQVFKPVSVLSGGEKSKLALAKLMMSGANTLLLDEPTNHMDIPAKEVMIEALQDYEGNMLCISHDRHFIQALATDIWELYEGQLLVYCGDYEYYLSKKEDIRSRHAPAATQGPPPAKSTAAEAKKTAPSGNGHNFKAKKELEKRFRQVEKSIMTLETEVGELEAQLHDPARQQDYQHLQEINDTLTQKQQELAGFNEEWAQLAETLGS